MKSKSSIVAMVVMISMLSFACSLFTRGIEVTQEPTFEPITELLVIEPASLPNAQKGVMYEAKIHISHNVTPVGDMAIQSGALPSGMELDFMEGEDTAIISGIPDGTGTYTFTLFAWCYGTQVSGQTLEKEYQIVVVE